MVVKSFITLVSQFNGKPSSVELAKRVLISLGEAPEEGIESQDEVEGIQNRNLDLLDKSLREEPLNGSFQGLKSLDNFTKEEIKDGIGKVLRHHRQIRCQCLKTLYFVTSAIVFVLEVIQFNLVFMSKGAFEISW